MEKITVTVQTEQRMNAINNLSEAILNVSRALANGTHVSVSNCIFNGAGMDINLSEEVTETKIQNFEDEVRKSPVKKRKVENGSI